MAEEKKVRRSALLIAFAVLVVLAGLAVGLATSKRETTTAVPSASTSAPGARSDARSARGMLASTRTDGSWPGDNGLSGVNGDPVLNTASVESFCTARGRACKIAQTYTDRTSWESMTSGTGWTFQLFADFDGVLVISQGLVPEGAGADLAACAKGDHDAQFQAFGTLMSTQDRADSIVRLGWEFNETTSSWRADNTDAWVGCYRHAAQSIRATNPSVLFDWTINAHDTPSGVCGGVSTNCYPGDEYVDIVGIDNYDHYPRSASRSEFDGTATAPEGLTWLYNFAREHGKLFSVGEWGVVRTDDAGTENPGFVTWMHAWFAAHAKYLAYEAYFSDCTSGGVQSSLFRTDEGCQQNPESAARYKALFSA